MKMLWNKETGEAREYEAVDAREMVKNSPDLYTDQNPNPGNDPDGDGKEGAPQNVASVENEFRREPVGDDPPVKERDQVIIRNPVTDRPRMAPVAGTTDADRRAKDDATRAEADRAARAAQPAQRVAVAPPPPPAKTVDKSSDKKK